MILLDLNYALLTDKKASKTPLMKQLEQERYDLDLIQMLQSERVILVSARPQKYRIITLANLYNETGWQPEEAFFNESARSAHQCKKYVLQKHILPLNERCVAIESNLTTRKMYAHYRIPSMTVDEFKHC